MQVDRGGRVLAGRKHRVRQEIGFGRIENSKEEIRSFTREKHFNVLRSVAAEAMPESRFIVGPRIAQIAMRVVEPCAIRHKNKPCAEALWKAVREYGVPLEVKDL